ncbi:MAG: hypothetical protein JHC26_01645 [Thermofilum sp.]|jgi:hypothetical protein|uniref:hypothetical protein n=1 Tax=Thermofilum sp. TaxID=1961369 RepID=UPI002582A759|nr:hypothetical protein [Thermofilum sp.]MCI4407765.1 hypothetical protein [Thermofilum sp.]
MMDESDDFWENVAKLLVWDVIVAVWLITQGLTNPSTAKTQLLYHAMLDGLLLFTLFASYFGTVKEVEDYGLDDELEEPPLSYVPYLISTVPPGLFMLHFFLVFGGKPLDTWFNWLIGYGVTMLVIVAIAYILFYKLGLD